MSKRLTYAKTVNGQAMQTHVVQVRLVPQHKPGRPMGEYKLSREDIPRLRRLLRTEKSIQEIAEEFAVSDETLRTFIKRRQICNLKDRRNWNSLQRSLEKLGDSVE